MEQIVKLKRLAGKLSGRNSNLSIKIKPLTTPKLSLQQYTSLKVKLKKKRVRKAKKRSMLPVGNGGKRDAPARNVMTQLSNNFVGKMKQKGVQHAAVGKIKKKHTEGAENLKKKHAEVERVKQLKKKQLEMRIKRRQSKKR